MIFVLGIPWLSLSGLAQNPLSGWGVNVISNLLNKLTHTYEPCATRAHYRGSSEHTLQTPSHHFPRWAWGSKRSYTQVTGHVVSLRLLMSLQPWPGSWIKNENTAVCTGEASSVEITFQQGHDKHLSLSTGFPATQGSARTLCAPELAEGVYGPH